jgi:Mrp family chromosome partitioning ATPase
MGKILNQLRRTQSKITVAAPIDHREDCEVVAVTPVNEDSRPFIEVGGKDKPAQASADVLAFGPLPTRSTLLNNDKPLLNNDKRTHSSAYTFATSATLRLLAAASTQSRQVGSMPQEPAGQPAAWLIAHHQPDHAISQQYRELIRGVRQTMRARQNAHTLLFVPNDHNIGATSALLNLAITAACENANAGKSADVLVVDGHFAAPGVAAQFGMSNIPGFADVVAGRQTWKETVRTTPIASLHLIGAGRTENLREPSAAALADIFQQLSSRYSTIFVDGPCCLEIDLALKFCVACDCVFPVVPRESADQFLSHDMIQRFAATGCHVAGAIVTQNN